MLNKIFRICRRNDGWTDSWIDFGICGSVLLFLLNMVQRLLIHLNVFILNQELGGWDWSDGLTHNNVRLNEYALVYNTSAH